MTMPTDVISHIRSLRQTFSKQISLTPPWGGAFGAGSSTSVIAEIEAQFTREPNSVEARLWWVYSQFDSGRVPVTALTSPLDEMFDRLKDDRTYVDLSFCIFGTISLALIERKQFRLAINVCEKALEFGAHTKSFSLVPSQELKQVLLHVLEEEIARAESKRESKTYIEALCKKRDSLRKEKKPKPAAPVSKEKIVNAQKIVESSVHSERLAKEKSQGGESSPALATSPWTPRSKALTLATAFLLALFGGYQYYLASVEDLALESLVMAVQAEPPSGLLLPSPEKIDHIENESGKKIELSDLNARLQSIHQMQSSSSEPASSSGGLAQNDRPVDSTPPTHDENAIALNSSSSTSSSSVDDGKFYDPSTLRRGPSPKLPGLPEKVSSFDAKRIASMAIESVGGMPERDRVEPSPSDNGMFGSTFRPESGGSRRALDGSELRSYPVEQFTTPLRYKMLIEAEVYSSPSLLSESVGRLHRNQKIKVYSRMGYWLEIKNDDGSRGFVYAQNAEEIQ